MEPALIVLAAGLGRRFGGPKQLEPVGPHGEPLFAITAAAAVAAGFGRVVVVTRGELAARVDETVATHLRGVEVEVVLQDRFGPSRERPWGTAHAVAACAGSVDGPVGVANADDYYGGDALPVLAGAVPSLAPSSAIVVGYPLRETLSSHGPVNRAVCDLDGSGRVVRLRECLGLRATELGIVDGDGALHRPDETVSMNLLGLGAGIVVLLASAFDAHASEHAADDEEYVLPDQLGRLLADGRIDLRCVATTGRWAGITRRSDLAALRAAVLADLD